MSSELESLRRELLSAIDEHEARLYNLEHHPTFAITMAEGIRQRRRVVARMRESGLSVERISKALGVPRSTALRDLEATRPAVPSKVLGLDGKRHPSSHADRRNGAQPGPASPQ